MANFSAQTTVEEESCAFCSIMDEHTAGRRHLAPELSHDLVAMHCVDHDRLWYRDNPSHTRWKPADQTTADALHQTHQNSHRIRRFTQVRPPERIEETNALEMEDDPKVIDFPTSAVA